MSLDLVVLNLEGEPAQTVSVALTVHHEMMVQSARLELDELLKLSDYYEDLEIKGIDLEKLHADIRFLSQHGISDVLKTVLLLMSNLIDHAIEANLSILVLAD